jgi:hypothetical protein
VQLATVDAFRSWASGVGIDAEDQKISEGRYACSLSFRSGAAEGRYWITPWETKQLLVFITTLLDAVSPWEFCWTLKREGVWSDDGDGDGMEVVLRSLGIPPSFDGAMRYDRSERGALTLLMVTQIAFGWCGYYDIYVVPSHGRQMVLTDDDGITDALFADEATLLHAIQQMAAAGFPLPDAPPDEMFPWQPWMGPKPADCPK